MKITVRLPSFPEARLSARLRTLEIAARAALFARLARRWSSIPAPARTTGEVAFEAAATPEAPGGPSNNPS